MLFRKKFFILFIWQHWQQSNKSIDNTGFFVLPKLLPKLLPKWPFSDFGNRLTKKYQSPSHFLVIRIDNSLVRSVTLTGSFRVASGRVRHSLTPDREGAFFLVSGAERGYQPTPSPPPHPLGDRSGGLDRLVFLLNRYDLPKSSRFGTNTNHSGPNSGSKWGFLDRISPDSPRMRARRGQASRPGPETATHQPIYLVGFYDDNMSTVFAPAPDQARPGTGAARPGVSWWG